VKRYLLDTHVLFWGLTARRRLSRATLAILESQPVFVSAISVWELMSKYHRGDLALPDPNLIAAIERAGATLMPLQAAHADHAAAIGAEHGDPMDRLLLGTARAEHMAFVTRDARLLEVAKPLLGDLLIEA
jgi:PIN domain nuclease of toxin-antitoxin system